jgi:hypothetical protein
MTSHPPDGPRSQDLVDVRLTAAIGSGGCVACVVRTRAERSTLESIIEERVLDVGFREGLEVEHGFCRRHAIELLAVDRRAAGILGSSILFGAIIERRVRGLRHALVSKGRGRRQRLEAVRRRPPCPACDQGTIAVGTALARLVERADDPDWAPVIAGIPFCLDDLGELLATAGDAPTFARIARAQLERLDDLQHRLEGFAHHSAHDRRHLLTDEERSAADEAARVLGGG